MTRYVRAIYIAWIVLRYGLDELVLNSFRQPWLHSLARVLAFGRKLDAPRGQRLREALEQLGPIFVKFGQVMSTRRDLLPADIADELARLQDRVPPFGSDIAVATIERAFRRPVDSVFASFERVPVASASIAQVHFATLINRQGQTREVAVKVGQDVKAGEKLAVIEAMKMENILKADQDCKVKKISAAAGESLTVDQIIIEFE